MRLVRASPTRCRQDHRRTRRSAVTGVETSGAVRTSRSSSLVRLAEADAFQAVFGLARREALWAIEALRVRPCPVAAASARASETVAEIHEPVTALRPMTAGGEVVEDYGHVGLTLRDHPAAFLRGELQPPAVSSLASRPCRPGTAAG